MAITTLTVGKVEYRNKFARGEFGVRANQINGSRGVITGGRQSGGTVNHLDYINIPTPSNAATFGVMAETLYYHASCSDGSRGMSGGGAWNGSGSDQINYITISVGSTGVWGGGSPTSDTIDYVRISVPGNCRDFGNLIAGRYGIAGCSDGSRGLFGSGAG